jgi:hypothetical protein
MASPRRIFRIYAQAAIDAELIRDFQQAKGEAVSGTINLLCKRDPAKLLARWGEELHELCGVLDGTHDDSYLMEATQTWYWASLHAAVLGATWESLHFEDLRRQGATCGLNSVPELRTAVDRLLATPDAKPEKPFLLWCVADHLYRRQTPADKQWSLENLMEADLQDMKKRAWMEPLLRMISE